MLFKKKNKKAQTIETYDKSAKALAERYDEAGPRIPFIEDVFLICKIKNPRVLEIGPGSGREAYQILKRTPNYIGVDASQELLKIASRRNPAGKFVLADIEIFEFPKHLDIIFSSASLIHSDKKVLEKIFSRMFDALEPGGFARVSLKWAPKYKEVKRRDKYGVRTYYLYSKEDIEAFPADFVMLKAEVEEAEGQKWLELILQKPHPARG
jgi:SAM-dependent methyltransferase